MKIKKILVALIGVVSLSVTSVFWTSADMLDLDIVQAEEYSNDIVVSDEFYSGSLVDQENGVASVDILSTEVSEDSISENETPQDPIGDDDPPWDDDEQEFFPQYMYEGKDRYDIIEVYIRDYSWKYSNHVFFVYDCMYKDWALYDYSKESAETFLANYKEKRNSDGTILYVPVAEVVYDEYTLRGDNLDTEIDESRIPIIDEEYLDSIKPNSWAMTYRFPFAKDFDEEYVYAEKTELNPKPYIDDSGYEEPSNPDTPKDPEYPEDPYYGYKTYSTEQINGHNYRVEYTAFVRYDGRTHLWSNAKISPKNETKQVGDVDVDVYCDGVLLSRSEYSVSCKNNVNVTWYNNNEKYQPYFTVSLKKPYNKDNSKMSKVKFYFNIDPYPLEWGSLRAKKAVVKDDDSVALTNLFFTFPDNRKVKLGVYNPKNGKGIFEAQSVWNGIMVTGYNNFSGTKMLDMSSPKKITYEW